MTDPQRIAQPEDDNALLKRALKRYMRRAMMPKDLAEEVEALRKKGQAAFDEADMLEKLIPLLKDENK